MTPAPGSPVRIVMTKWPDSPHWEFDGAYLGSDEHGDWIGIPAGTPLARPGMRVVPEWDQVALVPASGPDEQRAWIATFHAEGNPVRVYVDMATPPTWSGDTVRAVDLDLDVIRTLDRVYVDDEDEFADHQVRLGYPSEIVGLAMASRDRVLAAVQAGRPPYDDRTSEHWLGVLGAGRAAQ